MIEFKLQMTKNRIRVLDEFKIPILDVNDNNKKLVAKKIAGLFKKFE